MTDKTGLTIRPENLPARFRANLVPQETERALILVRQGFDPGMHLVLYQNRVTVTIDGLYWWARDGGAQFRVVSEPVVGKDLRESYGIATGEIGVIAKVYLQGQAEPICTGFGRASTDPARPVSKGSAVEAQHPYRMAEKRAEAQALRKLRPLGIAVQTVEEAVEVPSSYVDTTTGEIVEGTSRRVEEPAPFDDPEDAPMPAAAAVPPVAKAPATKTPVPQTEAEWRANPAAREMQRALLDAGIKAGLSRPDIGEKVNAIKGPDGVLRSGPASDLMHQWETEATKAQPQ